MNTASPHPKPDAILEEVVPERIVELAQANEALRKGELRLAGIFNGAMDAIITLDSAQRIVLFNPAAEKMFLCPVATALGRSLDPFIPERFHEQLHRQLADCERTDVSGPLKHSLAGLKGVRANGAEFALEASISPVEVAGEKFCTAILRDISLRQVAEDELRKAHETMRYLLTHNPAVLYRLKPGGNVFDPEFVSENVTQLLGFTPEETTRSDWWTENLHPEDCDAVRTTVTRELAGGGYSMEYRIRHKDGTYRWVRDDNRVLRDAAGEPHHVVGAWTDISQQKKAEAALNLRFEAQGRLAQIAATLPGVIYSFRLRTDGSASFPYAGPQSEEYLGFDAKDLAAGAAGIFARVHADDLGRVQDSIAESARTLAPWWEEFRLQHPRKGEVWISANSLPQREADGGTLWHGFAMDVTEQRRTEEALGAERNLLRTLFNLLPDDIYVKDTQGRFIAGNNAVARRMGVASPEELIGKSDADFFPAGQAAVFRAEELAVLAGLPVIDKEASAVGSNGVIGYSLTTKLPLQDTDGKIVGLVGSGRDISKLKLTEESLRLFRALVDQSSDVFEVIDPETGRFLDVNETGCAGLGYTRAEYLALSVFDIDPTVLPSKWPETMAAGSVSGEGIHRRKDGTSFPVEFNAKSVRLDREYFVTIVRDISERKKLEEQFLRMQRLEAIGTLASGIAHDLNNILAPMLMAAGLLKGKLTDQRDRNILSMVEQSAQRGAGIIGQLLTFSRGVEGARVSVQVRHLLKEMINIMRETFPRNLEIIQDVPNDLWCVVADATQLHQVLMNLCVNARDAMPNGGKLTLEASNVSLDETEAKLRLLTKAGSYLEFSVADTGCGIPPGIISRIFDPFFTTKGVGKGTGLGLSTVVGIAKSHDGSVTVQSEPGSGTVFRVYLPATSATDEPARARTTPPMPTANGELILIVDDEAPIRETTGRVLREHGYRAVAAENGREAIKLFVQHGGAVRLVLTDVMMPGMGALELVRALRILEPDLKIVATSGLGHDDKREELAAMGVSEMLPKPCPSTLLLKTVDRVLTSKR